MQHATKRREKTSINSGAALMSTATEARKGSVQVAYRLNLRAKVNIPIIGTLKNVTCEHLDASFEPVVLSAEPEVDAWTPVSKPSEL